MTTPTYATLAANTINLHTADGTYLGCVARNGLVAGPGALLHIGRTGQGRYLSDYPAVDGTPGAQVIVADRWMTVVEVVTVDAMAAAAEARLFAVAPKAGQGALF